MADIFNDFKTSKKFLTDQVETCKVLVVGDAMLDRYYFGEVSRISPEAPVPVTRILKEKETPGGAANVAHNLALLGCQVFLATVTGCDENQGRLTNLLHEIGVSNKGLISINDRPTTTKLRVIGGHQQMLRLDFEENGPISVATDKKLRKYIEKSLSQGVKSVIISDYGKGLCIPALCQYIIRLGNEAKIPVIIDPKGANWKKYSQAFLVTPNLKELGEVLRKSIKNEDQTVTTSAEIILRRFRLNGLVVTRSEQGLSLITQDRQVHVPTWAQEVFDVSGAGDTVIAVLGAALAGGIELSDAARLANLAAGVVVAKVGTSAIKRQELIETIEKFKETRNT